MENNFKKIVFWICENPLFFLLIFLFILFWPMLFSDKLFPGLDLLLIFYPYSQHFLSQQSFWTSGILGGFNIGVAPSTFAGNWIYYKFFNFGFLDFISFYNILIFFYFILTTVFSYLASRKIGFDKWVSVLVTSVYLFSAYNLSWMVNIATAASLFVFPALIYFLLKFKEKFNWFWPAAGGVVLGLGLITSHPQFALIGIFGGFLFSIFLAWENNRRRRHFIVAFAVIVLIGVALSAFQLIPEYQTSQLAQRGAGLSFSESQECALGIADFVRYIIPNFNFGVNCESLLYVGVLPLILAIFAIIYLRKDRRVLFWLLLLAFSLLFSIKYSPLAWIFHQFPIWSGLRGPARFLMLGNFALAVLSGYGFNWVLENRESVGKSKVFLWVKRIFFGFLSLIFGINIFGLFKITFIKLAQNYFDKYYYSKTIGLPIEHYHRAIENLVSNNFYAFSFLNKEFLIPFILSISAFLVIIFIKKFSKSSFFFVFLLSGFIWVVTSPMVSSGLMRDFFKESVMVNFFKNQKNGPYRIYSLMPNLSTYQLLVLSNPGVSDADQNEFFKTMLPPNLNLIYKLDSIDGYDVSMPRRTSRILSELLSERAPLGNKVAEARLKPEEKIKIFESRANLLRMMNVKYIISAYSLDEKIFKKVFETRATRFAVPIYIYENKKVLPRFYFTKLVKPTESDEVKALEKMLESDIDFNNFAFIECGNDCRGNFGGKIIDYEYKNGYLRLNSESQIGGWLVFSESYDRGWHAKVNGETASIYRANYIYQAIKVPAGKNLIEFVYQTNFFK